MGTGRPDEPRLVGESAEIRRFRDAVRVRIERAAADAGGDLRHIPPAVLLSLSSIRHPPPRIPPVNCGNDRFSSHPIGARRSAMFPQVADMIRHAVYAHVN